MSSSNQQLLRKLPSVEAILGNAELREEAAQVPRRIVADAVRLAIQETREELTASADTDGDATGIHATVLARARAHLRQMRGPYYRKVINATGVILHTGLGRAVVPAAALAQIGEQLTGYSLLQTDLATGRRGKRDGRLEWLLQQLTGAEAATVVNNNSAATMLVLNTVAKGGEVIVSRGQLVEIGGSFRLPEVMEASGARLVEVGTTNKTHRRDYEKAITEDTAAIMHVHPSNYKVYGFTAEVGIKDMVEIAHSHGLPLIDDLGAGALVDLSRFGFPPEPTLADSIRAGSDLVISSADKLIGGVQGGIILGKKEWVTAVRQNVFARILRVGKMTLTALEATLTLFLDEERAFAEVPTLQLLRRPLEEIARQARRIARAVRQRAPGTKVTNPEGSSQMGSGSLPTESLPTRLVAVTPQKLTPDVLTARLRRHEPPVFARIQNDQVLFDPRTLLAGEEKVLVNALAEALQDGPEPTAMSSS